jgi:hypothetical protein
VLLVPEGNGKTSAVEVVFIEGDTTAIIINEPTANGIDAHDSSYDTCRPIGNSFQLWSPDR